MFDLQYHVNVVSDLRRDRRGTVVVAFVTLVYLSMYHTLDAIALAAYSSA